MKYYKRLSMDPHNATTNRLAMNADGELVTTSTMSFDLPQGTRIERPSGVTNGQIRYSTTLNEIEARVNLVWEKVRTVRPATITVQQLGNGNNENAIFGPLNPLYAPSYAAGAQNIMVYVDNVYQIPGVNYTVGQPSTSTTTLSAPAAAGTFTLFLSDLTNIVDGQFISGSSAIPAASSVTSVYTVTNSISISVATTNAISSGTSLNFSFNNTLSYITFNGSVPYKPVVAILGYDGYFPPAP